MFINIVKTLKLFIMNYYDEIDPIGEEKRTSCLYCGIPTNETYCSTECKHNDNYDN